MTRSRRVETLAREVRAGEKALRDLQKRLRAAPDYPTWNGLIIEQNIAESKLKRLRAALDEAEREWQCPHCGDLYGPEDEDQAPVCDMCKKAGLT